MKKEIKCRVSFQWDDENSVWIATSEDVKGLVLESGSLDALLERVRIAIPELLALNSMEPEIIDYSFVARRDDRVAVYG